MKKFLIIATFITAISAVPLLKQLENEDSLDAKFLNFLTRNVNITDPSLSVHGKHPHIDLTVPEVIELYDYKVETYTIETSDNYILEVHRIPGSKKNPKANDKPVVFLQHGLLCSSMDWVIAGPESGLPFILSDAGYDVWMGNVRGNVYSRRHRYLTTNDAEYWKFSWHEIGVYDLPAMIDFTLHKTKRDKVFYIGHSQGTTSFFVMASELPDYNDKIQAMFALAPVVYCSQMYSPVFQAISKLVQPINLLAKLIGTHEFKPTDEFFKKFTTTYCKEHKITQSVCTNALFMITGFNEDQMDMALLPAIMAHVPAGAAVNQFVHYGQLIRSGYFRQMDFGAKGNLKKYKSISPPNYDIKKVTAPVALHYSVNDWLSDPKDVEKLYSQLPNSIGKFRSVHEKFNHLDYLYAKDVKTLLYDKVMNLMGRYED